MVEEGREPHQLRDLLEQWPRRREARARQSTGLQEIGRGQRAAASCQAGLGERPEYDVGERREAVQDERERPDRSEEHTSELQSLMRISYAVFCLKKKKNQKPT